MLKQAEFPPASAASPEELLRHLEGLQLRQRHTREGASRQRLAFTVGAIVLLVAGAVAALLYLFSTLQEMRTSARPPSTALAVVARGWA